MRFKGRRSKRAFKEGPLTLDGTALQRNGAAGASDVGEPPLGLADGGAGSSRMVGTRADDDWTSPFSSNPLESVRVIDRHVEPEPILADLELPAEEPEVPAPVMAPSPEPRSENLVAKYGGRYASFGRSASVRPKVTETRPSAAEASHDAGSYDGFARRLEAQRGAANTVSPSDTGSFAVISAALPIPVGDRLSPSDFDASVRWQERFGVESVSYRASLLGASAHRVVDLGCRTGRLALHFAQWGFDIVGVDDDPDMIAAASMLANASAEEIERARGSIEFMQGGPGELTRLLGPESVDAVMCVGNILPELTSREELRVVLEDLNAVIKPDGIFIASFDNYRKIKYEGQRSSTPTVVETDRGTRLYVDVYDYPAGGTHLDITHLMGLRGLDGAWRMTAAKVRHMVITPDMLTRDLVDAGFDVIEATDPYDANRTSPLEAESLVVVARRRLKMRSTAFLQ